VRAAREMLGRRFFVGDGGEGGRPRREIGLPTANLAILNDAARARRLCLLVGLLGEADGTSTRPCSTSATGPFGRGGLREATAGSTATLRADAATEFEERLREERTLRSEALVAQVQTTSRGPDGCLI
jgi:hypothetical protein